jgi:hypothetical protein
VSDKPRLYQISHDFVAFIAASGAGHQLTIFISWSTDDAFPRRNRAWKMNLLAKELQ